MKKLRRFGLVKSVLLGAFVLFLLIQLVPYGRAHSDPPVTQAAQWPSGPAEGLFQSSCGDCHSNMTEWRWYSNIAPASWLVQNDVDGGRSRFNVSEWGQMPQPELSEVQDKVTSGDMPPWQYTLAHPSTKLSSEEKQQLVDGLAKLYAKDPPPSGG
jgi:mono/diheme cytochrome c family protein